MYPMLLNAVDDHCDSTCNGGCTRLGCSGTALNVVLIVPVVLRIEQSGIKTWGISLCV